MASFLDGITNGLSSFGSGILDKASDTVSGIADTAAGIFGFDTNDREEAKARIEEQFKTGAMGNEEDVDGSGFEAEYTVEQKMAEWDALKYKESLKKTGKALGKYKEQPQEKTAVARSNAPKQGISGPKGYGRGEQAEPYEQMQRGMSTGDLEKMLLEAMRSNARMSIFQGGFKGGLL